MNLLILAFAALGFALPAADVVAEPRATADCTTGTPTTTAGYPIKYAWTVPTVIPESGYQPDSVWSSAHVVGTQVNL
jgi:hypothetical protein